MKRTASCLLLFAALLPLAQTVMAQRGRPNDPWSYQDPNNRNWNSSWNNRPSPKTGACFFADPGFRGNHFCVRAGDRLPSLPGNFGDNISSVQVYGRTNVRIFNDRNFKGGGETLRGSAPDLRQYRFRDGHTWNDRISSIAMN